MTATPEIRRSEPFLAWPGVANLRITLPLCLSFLKLFSSVYGGTSLLASLRGAHPGPYFHFELYVPFVPSMAALYLTVPLILLLTPFILRTWRDLTPFFLTLTVETLVAGLCFLLLPFAQAYPPRVASGFWGGFFRLADVLNLEYNEVPSLHIAFAITAALVFGRRRGPLGRILFAIWAVAVAVSTLLIHEHHLLDVASGVLLAAAVIAAVHRPVSRDSALDAVRLDALCLREALATARRDPRSLSTALALWVHSLPRWTATRPLRASWCLVRHVRDVLDGRRRVTGNPQEHAGELLRRLRGEAPAGDEPASVLAEFLATALDAAGRADLESLVALWRAGRRRRETREPWTAAALADHRRAISTLLLDLALKLDGAELQAKDAPELLDAIARCLPLRDLDRDLARGWISVPAEVLAQTPDGLSPGDLLSTLAVRSWLAGEVRAGAAALAAFQLRLPAVHDRSSREVFTAFAREMATAARRTRRRLRRDSAPGESGLLAGRDGAA
jgi:membrane-associated phospholipid phosphatase